MKAVKRIISMALVIAMLLSLLPMTYAAEPFAKSKQWTRYPQHCFSGHLHRCLWIPSGRSDGDCLEDGL